MEEYFKIFGINGTVLGVVTLTDVELILKITLLLVTIVWTGGKAVNEWRKLKKND
jgi:hypothetical protein|tara:strand:+ start:573 stop:737 length:165 start_codon:yes stop_codon:yes gene_type:complete